jgi:hypothetical protein
VSSINLYYLGGDVILRGRLSEYSLAEIFRFLEEGRKTGTLIIDRELQLVSAEQARHYIGFQHGKVVSYCQDLNQLELINTLVLMKYIDGDIAKTFHQQSKYMFKPLGGQLQSQGVLTDSQIEKLFSTQVIQPITKLFGVMEAEFSFDETISPLSVEMTGLQLLPAELTLRSLRILDNWQHLQAKLPDAEHGLQQVRPGLLLYNLEMIEMELWKSANGQLAIGQLAKKLALPLLELQKTAFYMVAAGILKEVSIDRLSLPPMELPSAAASQPRPRANRSPVSKKFLTNLVGFLKQQG